MEIGAHVWLRTDGSTTGTGGTSSSSSSSWGWVPAYIANKEPIYDGGKGSEDDDGEVHLVRLTLKNDPMSMSHGFTPSHEPPLQPYVGPGHLSNAFDVGVHSPQRYSHNHRPDDNIMRSPAGRANHGDVSMSLSTTQSSVWASRGSVDEQNKLRGNNPAQDHLDEFEITIDVDSEQLKRPEGLDDVKLRNIDTNSSTMSPQESEIIMSNVSDLIHLTHLHEPAILHSLRIRYDQDLIYTNTGPILIAVNPFKPMTELYSEQCMDLYRTAGEGGYIDDNKKRSKNSMGISSGTTPQAMVAASRGTTTSTKGGRRLDPHVYQTTDDAYRAMVRGIETSFLMRQGGNAGGARPSGSTSTTEIPPCNQSILVSGESGAGKTVTTKIVLNYLAVLSKRTEHYITAAGAAGFSSPSRRLLGKTLNTPNNDVNESTSSANAPITIEQQVLQSNPILEAFGNARTIRNDNSSRFGKYIDVHFTSSGKLTGATIETYLLEKVRLIQPTFGERNYHVFYQLLASATEQERAQFYLEDLEARDFYLLQSSDTYDRRDGILDSEQHLEMLDAMITIGFDADVIQQLMQLVVGVLFLGNLQFDQYQKTLHEDEGSTLVETEDTLAASQLLGVNVEELGQSLTSKTVKAGIETLEVPLNVHQAHMAKEALIKAVYGAAFDFVVQQTNYSIREEAAVVGGGGDDDSSSIPGPPGSTSSRRSLMQASASPSRGARSRKDLSYATGPAACIGVLDIFGFESFDVNTFEQMCINYTNEALQQQFNKYVFKLEQHEYQSEGILWQFISFPDNQDVLDLIDKKHTGILALLDEQCMVPQSSDSKFTRYLYAKCDSHARFTASSTQRVNHQFSVHHYAGPVEYTTTNWLEKNRDQLPDASVKLLETSTFPLIHRIRPFIRAEGTVSGGAGTSGGGNRFGGGGGLRSSSSRSGSSSMGGTATTSKLTSKSVGAQFTEQLKLLRKRIDGTTPHYIRCLKPNDQLIPHCFIPKNVVEQLRCGGVLEAVRVSRAGYPTRYPHEIFLRRYFILGSSSATVAGGTTMLKSSPVRRQAPGGNNNKNAYKPGGPGKQQPHQGTSRSHHQSHQQPTTQESLKHLIDQIAYDIWQADLSLIKSLREAQKVALPTPRNPTSEDKHSFKSPTKQRTLAAIHQPRSPPKAPTPSRKSQITSQLKELQKTWEGGEFPESSDEFLELEFADRCAIAGLQLGRTKVFLRREAFDRIESMRSEALKGAASMLQALARGVATRRMYHKMRHTCIKVQAYIRMLLAKNLVRRMTFERRAIYILQRCWRAYHFAKIQKSLTRTTRKKRLQATLHIQRAARGMSARSLLQSMQDQKRRQEEEAEEEAERREAAAAAAKVKADRLAKARARAAAAATSKSTTTTSSTASVASSKGSSAQGSSFSKASSKKPTSKKLERMLDKTAQQPAAVVARSSAGGGSSKGGNGRPSTSSSALPNYEDQTHVPSGSGASVVSQAQQSQRPTFHPELASIKTELHQCIDEEDWASVEKLLDKYPPLCHEEEPSTGELCLHVLARHVNAWTLLIDHVLLGNPNALLHRDRMGALPLHHAAAHNSLGALEILYNAYKEGVNQVDYRGRLPLHVASEFDALESVKFLLAKHPDGAYTMVHRPPQNSGGGLPLHVACRNFSSIGVITALLAENFASGKRTDENGDLPLHLILRGGGGGGGASKGQKGENGSNNGGENEGDDSVPVVDQVCVKTLLTCFSAAVSRTDMNGDLPLHISLKHQCTSGVIHYLLKQYPNAATVVDGEGHSSLYLALVNDADDKVVLSILNHAPYLAIRKDDPTGLLPIQVAMQHGHSHNVVYTLLKQDLPIDLKEKVEPQLLPHHYSWNFLVSESQDEYFHVVTKLLSQCTQPQVLALAHVEGPTGKMALGEATPVCKHELRVMLRLFNQLEVVNQRPAYSNPNSDTQIFYALRYDPPAHHRGIVGGAANENNNFTVIHEDKSPNHDLISGQRRGSGRSGGGDVTDDDNYIEDLDDLQQNDSGEGGSNSNHRRPIERTTVPMLTQPSSQQQAGANLTVEERLLQIRREKGQQVIAKLTSRSQIVERELSVRKQFKLSRNYVPAILSVHHTVQHAAYSEAMAEPGYCITMEGADTTCENLLLDCRQHRRDFPLKSLRRIGIALLHMHEHGLIHGDFGSHNIGKFRQRWKLLGVGGAVPLGEYTDPTRGFYHPPEAVEIRSSSSKNGTSTCSVVSIQAHPTYDIWAYGVVLYEAVVGFPLSPYARRSGGSSEEAAGADLMKIAKWDYTNLDRALKYVHVRDRDRGGNATIGIENQGASVYNNNNDDGMGALSEAYHLLQLLLDPNPRRRIGSMREVLEHPFFGSGGGNSDAMSVMTSHTAAASRSRSLSSRPRYYQQQQSQQQPPPQSSHSRSSSYHARPRSRSRSSSRNRYASSGGGGGPPMQHQQQPPPPPIMVSPRQHASERVMTVVQRQMSYNSSDDEHRHSNCSSSGNHRHRSSSSRPSYHRGMSSPSKISTSKVVSRSSSQSRSDGRTRERNRSQSRDRTSSAVSRGSSLYEEAVRRQQREREEYEEQLQRERTRMVMYPSSSRSADSFGASSGGSHSGGGSHYQEHIPPSRGTSTNHRPPQSSSSSQYARRSQSTSVMSFVPPQQQPHHPSSYHHRPPSPYHDDPPYHEERLHQSDGRIGHSGAGDYYEGDEYYEAVVVPPSQEDHHRRQRTSSRSRSRSKHRSRSRGPHGHYSDRSPSESPVTVPVPPPPPLPTSNVVARSTSTTSTSTTSASATKKSKGGLFKNSILTGGKSRKNKSHKEQLLGGNSGHGGGHHR